jgi:hypothetical protein
MPRNSSQVFHLNRVRIRYTARAGPCASSAAACRELSATQAEQAPQQQQQLAGGCYGDVEQLQSHWQELDAARKVMYAQMAVLTRCVMFSSFCLKPQLRILDLQTRLEQHS